MNKLSSVLENNINLFDKLNEDLNTIIVRISSLTDYVLLEQAKEEYELINNKIHNLNYKIIICKIILDNYQSSIYIKCNIEYYIGIDQINKKRLKNVDNINNRRNIKIISDAIEKLIIVKNIKNNITDVIGYNNVKLPLENNNLIIYHDNEGNIVKPN